MSWKSENKERDIVISSRVRLARNIKDIPFPVLIPENRAGEIVDAVDECLKSQQTMETAFQRYDISKLGNNEKRVLMEKHLISKELGTHWGAAVFIDREEDLSIMVNEEDHIRIQCILDGFQLSNTYQKANGVDDVLEGCMEFSFHERFGYLTSCPTNAGTGMRASVMLHLPSMTLNNQIQSMMMTLSKFGLTIRGIYGEGTQALGDLYQISNQNTLGVTEQEIIDTLHDVAREIIKKERDLRHEMLEKNRTFVEDKIYRAYGILSNARTIDSEESMKLLSLVRLGADLELLELDLPIINRLMLDTQPGILANTYEVTVSDKERDRVRAEHIRKELNRE